MKRIVHNPSCFIPHYKRIKGGNNHPSRSGSFPENDDFFLFDKRNYKSDKDYPKGFVKPTDIPNEPVKQPDYLEQNFRQYSWLDADAYRSNRPFFTGKDPLDKFIKPANIPIDNNFPVNDEIDSEAQNSIEQATKDMNTPAQEALKKIVQERNLAGEQPSETEQNIAQYQDGTDEIIKQVIKNTFPNFEINEAINELKEADGRGESQDLSQQEVSNDDITPISEPQPEINPQGITPLADEVMPDGMEQNLEDIIQQQPQEMMQEPPPDPLMMPEFFDPFMF